VFISLTLSILKGLSVIRQMPPLSSGGLAALLSRCTFTDDGNMFCSSLGEPGTPFSPEEGKIDRIEDISQF
jgi:hypothetical protein